VVRGAPCEATWEAAQRVKALSVEEAPVRIGLEVQYFCVADPSAWDPISGKIQYIWPGNFIKLRL